MLPVRMCGEIEYKVVTVGEAFLKRRSCVTSFWTRFQLILGCFVKGPWCIVAEIGPSNQSPVVSLNLVAFVLSSFHLIRARPTQELLFRVFVKHASDPLPQAAQGFEAFSRVQCETCRTRAASRILLIRATSVIRL
jgi:hypothetical protein